MIVTKGFTSKPITKGYGEIIPTFTPSICRMTYIEAEDRELVIT